MTYKQDKEDNEISLIKVKQRGFEKIINKLDRQQKQNRDYLDNTLKYAAKIKETRVNFVESLKGLLQKQQRNEELLIDMKKEIQDFKTNIKKQNKTLIEDVKRIIFNYNTISEKMQILEGHRKRLELKNKTDF